MDDWDSILDPYQDSLKEGYHEGQQAGLQSGYNDGWHLGKIKALEIGIELGYMHSVASEALECLSREGELQCIDRNEVGRGDVQTERRIKKLKDFLESVQSFPSPDVIFSTSANDSSASISLAAASNGNKTKEDDNDNDDGTDYGTTASSKASVVNAPASAPVDIVQQMQRIRAKFKTILVQMKMPHLTLKKVMNDRIPNKNEETREMDTTRDEMTGSKQKLPAESMQMSVYQDNEW